MSIYDPSSSKPRVCSLDKHLAMQLTVAMPIALTHLHRWTGTLTPKPDSYTTRADFG